MKLIVTILLAPLLSYLVVKLLVVYNTRKSLRNNQA